MIKFRERLTLYLYTFIFIELPSSGQIGIEQFYLNDVSEETLFIERTWSKAR